MKANENLGLAAAEACKDISLSRKGREDGSEKEKNEYQSYSISSSSNFLKQKQIKHTLFCECS